MSDSVPWPLSLRLSAPFPASPSPHLTEGPGVWAKYPSRLTAQAQGYKELWEWPQVAPPAVD